MTRTILYKKAQISILFIVYSGCYCSGYLFSGKINTSWQEVIYDPVLFEERQKYLEEFARLLEQNSKRISSIKDSINGRYKYRYDITGIRKSADDPYKDIPYYGKCDLQKGFIFSLHKPLKNIHG